MSIPFLRVEAYGGVVPLPGQVSTVGRGRGADVRLDDPSVSRLHAEIVRRGPYVYVADLGLSRHGTQVNGRPVARRVLDDGDVLSFGSARCRIEGIPREELPPGPDMLSPSVPELTRRELDVLGPLCRPALSDEAFVTPATAREIAGDLAVSEAAVKQHLLRLYQKFRIPEGANRRTRLANEVIRRGLVRPHSDGTAERRPRAEDPDTLAETLAVAGRPVPRPLPLTGGTTGISEASAAAAGTGRRPQPDGIRTLRHGYSLAGIDALMKIRADEESGGRPAPVDRQAGRPILVSG